MQEGTARAEDRAAPPSDLPVVCCFATCTSPQRPADSCKGSQPCGQHILCPGSLGEFIAFVGHISGAQKGGLLTGNAQH
jgi:hypothetical protein